MIYEIKGNSVIIEIDGNRRGFDLFFQVPNDDMTKPAGYVTVENKAFEADIDAFTGQEGLGAEIKSKLQVAI